jgi:hypothetical protein
MPRYYFEVESQTTIYEDSEGEEYPTGEAAFKMAQRLGSDMSEGNATGRHVESSQ